MSAARSVTISVPLAALGSLLVAALGVGGGAVVQRATASEPTEVSALRDDVAHLQRSLDALAFNVGLICSQTSAPCQGSGDNR